MESVQAPERALKFSASVYPRHENLIRAIRLKRGIHQENIPDKSAVVQEAIEDLARRELDPEQFDQLMIGAA